MTGIEKSYDTVFLPLVRRLGEASLRQRLEIQIEHSADWFGGRGETLIHFENLDFLSIVVKVVVLFFHQMDRGMKNLLDYRLKRIDLFFPNLPRLFDGYRILQLSDLHADAIPDGAERLCGILDRNPADLCVMTGDFRFLTHGEQHSTLAVMKRIVPHCQARDGLIGILGNHDFVEIVPELEHLGITMLLNEHLALCREGETLGIVGVDDAHFYDNHDIAKAQQGLPPGSFQILLSHTPEIFREAEAANISLFLAGHTHGGQICLPGRVPLITNASSPRKIAGGTWHWKSMIGHTSRGTGASGVPVRFFCPPEVTLLTLKRSAPGTFHAKWQNSVKN